MHLLLCNAHLPDPAYARALDALALPHLRSLAHRLQWQPAQPLPGSVYGAAHEPLLATLLGLPWHDGHWPATGLETSRLEPCGWLSPCHWEIGERHMVLHDPAQLQLDDTESRALCASIAPLLLDDALELGYQAPERWLLRGALVADLRCAALERVIGQPVHDWLAQGPTAQRWRTLQAEIEMLLYTHPVNEARNALGKVSVNAVWLHGAGSLAALPSARPCPEIDQTLGAPLRSRDMQAWLAAWRHLDDGVLARLNAAARAGAPVRLTLCGEHAARTFGPTQARGGARLLQRIRPQRPSNLLSAL